MNNSQTGSKQPLGVTRLSTEQLRTAIQLCFDFQDFSAIELIEAEALYAALAREHPKYLWSAKVVREISLSRWGTP